MGVPPADPRVPSGPLVQPVASAEERPPSASGSFTERYAGTPFAGPAMQTQTRSGSNRLAMAAAALVVVVLVAGGGLLLLSRSHGSSPGSSNETTPGPTPHLSSECVVALTPLVSGLEDLDSRLSVGLNFSDYSSKVGDLKVVYDKIKPSTLDTTCLTIVGTPAETALNDYIEAYNSWNTCIGKVGCTNASIKSSLQDDWAKATDIISGLRDAMP